MKTLTPKPNLTNRNKPKPLSEMDIFRVWQAKKGFRSDAEFARALEISRSRLNNWLAEINAPPTEWLQALARDFAGEWQSELAAETLEFREADVPCVCSQYIGDNGPCPKHGAPIAEEQHA